MRQHGDNKKSQCQSRQQKLLFANVPEFELSMSTHSFDTCTDIEKDYSLTSESVQNPLRVVKVKQHQYFL